MRPRRAHAQASSTRSRMLRAGRHPRHSKLTAPPARKHQLCTPTVLTRLLSSASAAAGCLPHDPLFDLLPAGCPAGRPAQHAASPAQVAAALAAAAAEVAALAGGSTGVGVTDESADTLADTWAGPAPQTCRKRSSADATPVPAVAQLAGGQRLLARAQLDCEHLAPPPSTAPAPHTATPRCAAGGGAAGKRQRLLLLSAAAGAVEGEAETPGNGVGSTSRGAPQRHAGLRIVARDLSFTPAPAPRQPTQTGKSLPLACALVLPTHVWLVPALWPTQLLAHPWLPHSCAGTPPTAGSASRCGGTWPPSPQRGAAGIGPPACRTSLKPFSLLRVRAAA